MAIDVSGGHWLTEWPTRIAPMTDLICFPGAGAGASVFLPWVNRVPAFAAVLACQLPGRENRIDEPLASSLADAADNVAAAYLAARPARRPFVLFGHSMGGMLAFEVGRRLADKGRIASAMILSASAPPNIVRKNTVIDDAALRDLLIGYDPDNRRITGNAELYAALAPVISSDIAMLRRHQLNAGTPPLDLSVHLMSGAADTIVPVGSVARWADFFLGETTHHEIEGGHFFPFRESQDQVLALIAGVLRGTVARRMRG